MSNVKHRVDLSDAAFDNLRAMALSANYGQIGPFLMACAFKQVVWYDARPAELQEATTPDQTPIWYDSSPRVARSFSTLPTSYLVTIAHSHHIRAHARQRLSLEGRDPARSPIVARRPDTQWQLINAVLEAIGLGYLRPDSLLPHNTRRVSRKLGVDKSPITM